MGHSEYIINKLNAELEATANNEEFIPPLKRIFPSWQNRQVLWIRRDVKRLLDSFGEKSKFTFENRNELLIHLIITAAKQENLTIEELNSDDNDED